MRIVRLPLGGALDGDMGASSKPASPGGSFVSPRPAPLFIGLVREGFLQAATKSSFCGLCKKQE
jgi:hypothetical protein